MKEHAGGRIAVIADIARDRRDRKGKSLPLISADHADQERKHSYGFSVASRLRVLCGQRF